jgi:phosphoglycerate kinase
MDVGCERGQQSMNEIDEIIPLMSVDLSNKTLILRVDFNCPINRTNHVPILVNTRRIDEHIRHTLQPLIGRTKAPKRIILLSHQGRNGYPDCTSLRPHFAYLRGQLERSNFSVEYVSETVSEAELEKLGAQAVSSKAVLEKIQRMRSKSILLLENVRFDPSEENCASDSPKASANHPLIKMLENVQDRVVALDGFSVAHRSQPSVTGLAILGPLYAGPVVTGEMGLLSSALVNPQPPMVLVIGGAKIDDSLNSIERFLKDGTADKILTGGLVGLLFLKAKFNKLTAPTLAVLEKSVDDFARSVRSAQTLLSTFGEQIRVPADVALAPPNGPGDVRKTVNVKNLADMAEYAKWPIGDIGAVTVAEYIQEISSAKTLVVNGTMGKNELKCFVHGTQQILSFLPFYAHDSGAMVLVGGGDTGAAMDQIPAGFANTVNNSSVHQSSSGKAFLQVLSTGDFSSLPGIQALTRSGHVQRRPSNAMA